MILYASGDSYSVLNGEGAAATKNRYAEFLGQDLGARKIINTGLPGSCNNRIIRVATRDLLDLKKQNPNEKILALITVTNLIRTEYWDNAKPATSNDGHFRNIQIHETQNNASAVYYSYAMEWFKLFDDEAEQTNLLKELVLFTGWCRSQHIDYLILTSNNVTFKPIDYTDVFVKSFADQIFNDPYILNFTKISFVQHCLDQGFRPYNYDKWGVNGHHSEPGHRSFGTFLTNYLKDLKWK
jgi:hypothetical protein